LLPPDSPPFDPLPTPATPPSLSIGPKKALKTTPVKEKEKEKDGKDSIVKDKELKDKVEKDGNKGEVGMKDQSNMSAIAIASANANAKEKEMMSRKDKVAEAHRLRAAASAELETADTSSLKSSPDSWSPKILPLTAPVTSPLTGKLSGDEPDMKRPMPALTKDPNSSSCVSVSTSKMSVSPTNSLGPSLTMAPGMIQSQTRSTNGKTKS
jgi:hypothetical protein